MQLEYGKDFWFKLDDDFSVDDSYYKVKNSNKYDGDNYIIMYNNVTENIILNELDENDDIIYWGIIYDINIEYWNPFSKMKEVYTPYVRGTMRLGPNEAKDLIYDVYNDEFKQYHYLYSKNESEMSKHERDIYKYMYEYDTINNIIFEKTNEYCEKLGIDYMLVSNEGEIFKYEKRNKLEIN